MKKNKSMWFKEYLDLVIYFEEDELVDRKGWEKMEKVKVHVQTAEMQERALVWAWARREARRRAIEAGWEAPAAASVWD